MCELTKNLQSMIDPKDPTQRLIGALAAMIDSKFTRLSERLNKQDEVLIKQNKALEGLKHQDKCPMGVDSKVDSIHAKVETISKTIEVYTFITTHPKIAIVILIGVCSILGMGVNEILDKVLIFIK